MQYKLYNDDFDIIIDSKGCEIISVVRKQDSKQYIWNGNPDAWKRHTPVLFPLVGRYKNDTSVYKGKEYHMTQHGFARDSEFTLVHKEDNVIIMSLTSSEATKQKYPFDFELMITHRLSGNNISTIWEVKNTGDDVMYFSIGGHPAFVCGDNAIGAQLRFGTDNDNVAYKLLSEDGLLMPEEHYLTLVNNNVTITKEFFDKDALIVENSGIKKVSLSKDCEPVVEVMFNAPVFGLWSAAGKGVPFVCIEPWYGRTDDIDSDGSLDAREWGNELAGGETFTGGYRCKFL